MHYIDNGKTAWDCIVFLFQLTMIFRHVTMKLEVYRMKKVVVSILALITIAFIAISLPNPADAEYDRAYNEHKASLISAVREHLNGADSIDEP